MSARAKKHKNSESHALVSSQNISSSVCARKPSPDQHIFLIGFMGAGKSTVARKLAMWFGKISYDMDIGIVRMAGKSIPQIFSDEGEAGFRNWERKYLEYLKGLTPGVVSCGGGIITNSQTRAELKKLGFVVFLQVDIDEVYERISSIKSRPLLSQDRQKAIDLLESRTPLYLECADLVFDTSGKSSNRVASELGDLLFENKEGAK